MSLVCQTLKTVVLSRSEPFICRATPPGPGTGACPGALSNSEVSPRRDSSQTGYGLHLQFTQSVQLLGPKAGSSFGTTTSASPQVGQASVMAQPYATRWESIAVSRLRLSAAIRFSSLSAHGVGQRSDCGPGAPGPLVVQGGRQRSDRRQGVRRHHRLPEGLVGSWKRVGEIAERAKSAGAMHHRFGIGDGFVLVVDEWASAEQFEAFFSNPELQAFIGSVGGGPGRPGITVTEAISSPDEF